MAVFALSAGLLSNSDKIAFGQYGGGGGSIGITPSNPSISINDGAANTTSTDVTLTLGATNATTMAISNNASFTGVSYEAYAISKEWTLTSGAGTKTIYAKFRNSNDSAVVSGTIALNTTGGAADDSDTGSDDGTGDDTDTGSGGAYANGTLLRVSDAPEVYVIKNGNRIWIRTAEEFNAAGYSWADIKIISLEALGQISSSVVLIRATGDPKVYVIENNKRKHISSVAAFNAAGYSWADIKVVSAAEVDAYLEEGGVILIRISGDPKVYVIKNNKRQHVPSAAAFNAAGYSWSSIQVVSQSEADAYSEESYGGGTIVITFAWLRIRGSNNTSSNILGHVYKGETYEILNEQNNWYKINTKAGIGWVSGDYAEKQ